MTGKSARSSELLNKHQLRRRYARDGGKRTRARRSPLANGRAMTRDCKADASLRWPGKSRARHFSTHAMVEYVDILPTFLDAVGKIAPPPVLDGQSFLPVLAGRSANIIKTSSSAS